MNYSDFKSNIESGLNANKNYQPLVLCHLAKFGLTPKNELAYVLWEGNKNQDRKVSFFMSVPVWKVLENKGMIEKIQDSYQLTLSLNETQKHEITVLCHRVKRAHN